MSTGNYGQFEKALRKAGFLRTRTGEHNLWERTAADGSARRVIVCAKPLRPIPTQVLPRLLQQSGLSAADLSGTRRP
ncbi:MAG: hypothetical protein PVH68_09980 [Armatimonadota bacterium]|jgi:predicted RNA binding protein YcfA (HicA-like mRNA interferase family)